MGQRSQTETISALLVRLLLDRTSSQADLARHAGVTSRTAARVLHELSAAGVPLEREQDPPQVYWSVPRGWLPGGMVFSGDEATHLLQQLALAPRSAHRDRLMARIAAGLSGSHDFVAVSDSPELPPDQLAHVTTLRSAAARKSPVRIRYFSASRGMIRTRIVSVQHLDTAVPPRFVACCHSDDKPRWFRLDGVESAEEAPTERFVALSPDELSHYLSSSAGGFHAGSAPIEVAFFVADAAHRWVERNLPLPAQATDAVGGREYRATTSALPVVARFIVGLGDMARALTPELRDEVLRLANGARSSCEDPSPQD